MTHRSNSSKFSPGENRLGDNEYDNAAGINEDGKSSFSFYDFVAFDYALYADRYLGQRAVQILSWDTVDFDQASASQIAYEAGVGSVFKGVVEGAIETGAFTQDQLDHLSDAQFGTLLSNQAAYHLGSVAQQGRDNPLYLFIIPGTPAPSSQQMIENILVDTGTLPESYRRELLLPGMVDSAANYFDERSAQQGRNSAEFHQFVGEIIVDLFTGGGKTTSRMALSKLDDTIILANLVEHTDGALATAAREGTQILSNADEIKRYIKCFSRDTLVSTEAGLRPIGEIEVGDRVRSFDFSSGEWKLRTVTDRIDNEYQGPVVTVETDGSSIETTIHHPFWVVSGHELSSRPTPRSFEPDEDQNQALRGRWVNSHDLLAGDTIVGADGKQRQIRAISQRYEESFPVSNLTIGDYHNFAVGDHAILVHNESICDQGRQWLQKLLDDGDAAFGEVAKFVQDYDNGADVLRQLVAPTRTVDLFQSLRGRNLSNLTRQQVGDIGEDVAQRFLGENGFTDIISVQNRSGNGIDIVARASDGRLVFFEVKSSRLGRVGNLSTRQQSMTSFVEDVLGQAATGTGRYRHLDAAAQDIARRLLREFRRNPLNGSGNAVGVDLLNEIIRISPWR